jgi:hypothetical protein
MFELCHDPRELRTVTLHEKVAETVIRLLSRSDVPAQQSLTQALRLIARWRSQMIDQAMVRRDGCHVREGPFKGMQYVDQQLDGCLIARLLGCYESELHPHIERLISYRPDTVIDIGCAEGYYAVGLARRMPWCQVYAFDIDPRGQALCSQLATANGVKERVTIAGEFRGADFASFAGRKVLVFCDIEGAECALLDPVSFPALRSFFIVVECHDGENEKISDELERRFASSHDIVRLERQLRAVELPAWFRQLSELDQLLSVWEWRSGPTPWLVMSPRSLPS